MSKNQLSFFATKADLESLLGKIEASQQLQFVEAGLFNLPEIKSVKSLLDGLNLGYLSVGNHNFGPCYLIANRETFIELREVPQRGGGSKYAVDQMANRETIAFRPGGIFGDCYLIDGQAGTISDDPISLELFYLVRDEVRSQFTKVKNYYLGAEASDLWDKGWRLTSNVKASATYDLKRGGNK